jgi:hypothetical protein
MEVVHGGRPSHIGMRNGGGDGLVMRPSRVCMREGGGGGRWLVDGGMAGRLGWW